jgi:uncharacterized protein
LTAPTDAAARPDPDSEPFFAGLETGELRLQRCGGCRRFQFPPRPFCTRCSGTSLGWERATGEGTVYSSTVCHRAGTPEMRKRIPFVVGLVDLAEGVRMLALLEVAPETAAIGLPVKAAFRRERDHSRLVFAPASEDVARA